MRSYIPNTLGFEINKALEMLEGYNVIVTETSTVFQDKKDERSSNTPVVVRQLNEEACVRLTVTRFK